jgi:hypothetical protein
MPVPVTKFQDLLNAFTKNPEYFTPGYTQGSPLYKGAPGQMLNAFKSFVPGQGGMLTRADETGMFGISPLSGQMTLKSSTGWGFNANPVTKSIGFDKGSFAVGGSFNKYSPSAYINYGPVNIQGSLGFDPSIQMNINTNASKDFIEPTMMQEFLAGDTVPQQSDPTAREELEQQINQYRNSNPTWYRP